MDKGKCHTHFKKWPSNQPRELQVGQLHFSPMEQSTLDHIFGHINEKVVMRNSHDGFTRGKSCLTSLITF